MNHSKYNPKYDPKNISNQSQTTAPVEQAPTVTPVVNTSFVQAATSPQTVASNSDAVIVEPSYQDAKSDSQDSSVPTKAAAATTDRGMDVSISDQHVIGQGLHAVREPSALTGGLPELPAAPTHRETGEKTPELSAKAIS
jgi:hypothetical protein